MAGKRTLAGLAAIILYLLVGAAAAQGPTPPTAFQYMIGA